MLYCSRHLQLIRTFFYSCPAAHSLYSKLLPTARDGFPPMHTIYCSLHLQLNFPGVSGVSTPASFGSSFHLLSGVSNQADFRAQLMLPMQIYLSSRNSSTPYFDPSLPRPDCFTPPNGATSVEIIPSFTPTKPYSRDSETRHERGMLLVNMYAANPALVSLA